MKFFGNVLVFLWFPHEHTVGGDPVAKPHIVSIDRLLNYCPPNCRCRHHPKKEASESLDESRHEESQVL